VSPIIEPFRKENVFKANGSVVFVLFRTLMKRFPSVPALRRSVFVVSYTEPMVRLRPSLDGTLDVAAAEGAAVEEVDVKVVVVTLLVDESDCCAAEAEELCRLVLEVDEEVAAL
jgi:hypothetical protein